jgi:Na+-transporting NADH:ubiquinone oxidoreductase subunit C
MNLRDKSWFPVIYMLIITAFFSAIIIAFGSLTRKRVADNERIAFERAVLQTLPLELPHGAGPRQIHEIYIQKIEEADPSSAGALRFFDAGTLLAYALPLDGPGFWAPIKGVIGIAIDQRTITGISFYEQNETPGLGGEIVTEQFRDQFIGKTIPETGMPLEILPPTATLDDNAVHAITGATQTSNRLGRFMNEQLTVWRDRMAETR